MTRHDARRRQRRQAILARDPLRQAGAGAHGRQQLHRDVAGEQHLVRLDEGGRVAARVVEAHGQEPHGDAAEVERVLLLEGDVGLAELGALQQLGVERREAGEALRHLEARGRDLVDLILRADHLRRRREAAGAEVVLGVHVRRHEIQLGVLADLRHFTHHRRAVAGAEAGVDHQRRARADDDADVRHQRHAVVRDHVDVRGDLLRHAFADQRRHRRRRGRLRRSGAGCCRAAVVVIATIAASAATAITERRSIHGDPQFVDLPLASSRTTSPSFSSRMPASTFSRSPMTSQTISSGRMKTRAASARAFSSSARTFFA